MILSLRDRNFKKTVPIWKKEVFEDGGEWCRHTHEAGYFCVSDGRFFLNLGVNYC